MAELNSIYISGPMTGIYDNNREEFNKAEKFLRSHGFITSNPIEISDSFPDATYEELLSIAIGAMLKCKSVAMITGWRQSKGACIEYIVAKHCGLKIIDAYSLHEIKLSVTITEH